MGSVFDLERLDIEKLEHGRTIPSAQRSLKKKLQIGQEGCLRHVLGIQPKLCREDHRVIVALQMMIWETRENLFLAGESDGGGAGDAGTTTEITKLMFWDFGPRSDQAHVALEYVKKLGQFIELPAAQKWSNWGEPLIVGCRDGVVPAVLTMLHGSEFQNREPSAVQSCPLL